MSKEAKKIYVLTIFNCSFMNYSVVSAYDKIENAQKAIKNCEDEACCDCYFKIEECTLDA